MFLFALRTGTGIFIFCLLVHVVLWRVKRPRNDMAALFLIFMCLPAALAVLAGAARMAGLWDAAHWVPAEGAAALLLHFALASAYIQSYPPAQAESPSLKILILIARYGEKGLTRDEILNRFDNAKLVGRRFEDLVNNRLVYKERGVFHLTSTASCLIRFFIFYRKCLGLRFKGG